MEKTKPRRMSGRMIGIIILAAILAVLIWPELLFFLSDKTQALIETSVRSLAVGASDGVSVFSLQTVSKLAAMICGVLLICFILNAILDWSSNRGKRKRTVALLLISVLRYAMWLVLIIWGLTIMGVNILGVFASLGIAALIIGFGAQSLIEDVITGVFIIFEGQYNVGDIIILDDFRGVVRRIGVRTTCIEDAGGNIKIVNNSDIRNLQNRSDNPSYAICDVGISYGARVEDVEKVLAKGLPEIYEKNKALFLGAPVYRGVQQLGDSAVILRVVAETAECNIFDASRALNRAVLILFDDNGIEIPLPQVVVTNAGAAK